MCPCAPATATTCTEPADEPGLTAREAVGLRVLHVSPLWTSQRPRFGPDVAAAYADRGENRDPGSATHSRTNQLTMEMRLENGPLGARGKLHDLTSGATAVMCPAFDAAR